MAFLAVILSAGPLLAADVGSKDKIINAAKQLGDKNNCSWEVTATNLNSRRFHFGPNDGKIIKGGYTWYSMKMNDNTTEILMQGTNAAVKPPDSDWKTRAKAAQGSVINPVRLCFWRGCLIISKHLRNRPKTWRPKQKKFKRRTASMSAA